MKKKLISVLIAISLVLTLNTGMVQAVEETGRGVFATDEYEMATTVISALDIMEYEPDNARDLISRVDFAVFLGRLMRVDEYSTASVTYYKDIPVDHYALACVNYLTEIGGFDGYGDSEFRPDDPITPIEAAKVIFNVLGYRTYATVHGGYPVAYQQLAEKTGLLDDFAVWENTTREELMLLLFRAGFIELGEIDYISNNNVAYCFDGEECLFQLVWDIYDNYGVVTASGVTTLDDSHQGHEGYARIEGKEIQDGGIDTTSFLGRYVRALTIERDNGRPVLLWMTVKNGHTKELQIDAREFVNYEDHTIFYTPEDSNKLKSVRISDNATIVYNGRLAEYDVDSLFKISKGEIYVLSNNGGSADTVIINSYETYVVGYVDKENQILYDKLTGSCIVEMKKFDHAVLYQSVGRKTTLDSVTPNTVVSIKANGEFYLDIYLSGAVIEGTVTEAGKDYDGQYITVDNTKYWFDADFVNKSEWFTSGNFMGIGKAFKFYLDYFGEIAYVETMVIDEASTLVGYLIKAGQVPEVFQNVLRLKLMTSTGNVIIYDCDSRIKIDGISYNEVAKADEALARGDGEVILYKLSDKGKITYIDTTYRNPTKETGNSLTLGAIKAERTCYTENTSLGGEVMPTASTLIFNVPAEEKDVAPERYFTVSSGNPFANGERVLCAAYKMSEESITHNVVVHYESAEATVNLSNQRRLFVLSDVYKELNEDGDIVYKLIGYFNGAEHSYTVGERCMERFVNKASDRKITEVSQLIPGDAFRIAVNGRNEITAMEMMIDFTKGADSKPAWAPLSEGSWNHENVARVYCKRKKDGYMEVIESKSPDSPVIWIANLTNISRPVTVVDTRGREVNIRSGNVNDILEYDVLGDNLLPMYVYNFGFSMRDIIVYI